MVSSGKPGNKAIVVKVVAGGPQWKAWEQGYSSQGGSWWSPVESLGTRLVDKVVAGGLQWKAWEQGYSSQGGSWWCPVESLGTRLVDKVVAVPQWKAW